MSGNLAQRFFGGPPLAVIVKLAFVSLIVGVVLMWLDIEPFMLFRTLQRLAQQLWSMGFDAFRDAGRYLVAGAMVVVPIWFVARLLSLRGAR